MEILILDFIPLQLLLFMSSLFYLTFKMDPRWKWIFGSIYSVVSFMITQTRYHSLIYPYSFDFYWNAFTIFIIVIPVLNHLINRNIGKNKIVSNPFTTKIFHEDTIYYLQFGMYTFDDIEHSSLKSFEPIRLQSDGSFELSDSSHRLISEIHSPIHRALKLGSVTVCLIKLPSNNPIHHKFVLIAYTKSESVENFRSLDRLHISETRFSRLELNSYSNKLIRKLVCIDQTGNLVFNTNALAQLPKYHIEMGTYEFELLQKLIGEYNNRKLEVPYMYGKYYIGSDLRQHPVFMDEPSNVLYIGSSDFLPQILNFDFIMQGLIITDNQNLISQINHENPKEIIIKSIHDIRINLVEYGLKHPKFLELLFELWAKLLPDDNKTEYSPSFVKLISQFIELKYLLDGEETLSQLMTRDLLVSKTYREFNIDISTDVLSKFRGLFDDPVFNGFKQETTVNGDNIEHIEDFLTLDAREMNEGQEKNQLRYRVIDISGISERQKQALLILFCLMKEQALIPSSWLVFSVNATHKVSDIILKHLGHYQDFRQILLHMNEIGNDLSWIHSFDCKIHDKHLNHQQMTKYLGIDKNMDVDGLFVHQSFGRKTILQTKHDGGIYTK
ncbi:MAG: hypothetical protein HeimC2_27680 [Candidatus Heimdallarchaeota archaeon LC_2]|nr:MAG: hypothetical protein HeimC2_27680 [Candidatus Heimdallarchaeota archaeon LC_2]